MKVWIIERDHEPMTDVGGRIICFLHAEPMKRFLNQLPTGWRHYYDAVLYERIESGRESKIWSLRRVYEVDVFGDFVIRSAD